jgi:hypothetical protein
MPTGRRNSQSGSRCGYGNELRRSPKPRLTPRRSRSSLLQSRTRSGDPACSKQDGAPRMPRCSPYPAGLWSASGSVPFEIVSTPLPAPWTAQAAAAGAPKTQRAAAPSGWASAPRRADISGGSCAGSQIPEAALPLGLDRSRRPPRRPRRFGLEPLEQTRWVSGKRGDMNQVAAKTKASSAIARPGAARGSRWASDARPAWSDTTTAPPCRSPCWSKHLAASW